MVASLPWNSIPSVQLLAFEVSDATSREAREAGDFSSRILHEENPGIEQWCVKGGLALRNQSTLTTVDDRHEFRVLPGELEDGTRIELVPPEVTVDELRVDLEVLVRPAELPPIGANRCVARNVERLGVAPVVVEVAGDDVRVEPGRLLLERG